MELTCVNKDCLCCYRQVRNSRKFQAPCWDSTSVYELTLYTKWRVATGQRTQNQKSETNWNPFRELPCYIHTWWYWDISKRNGDKRSLKNSNLSLRHTFQLFISWASITQYDRWKIPFMKEAASTALPKSRLHMDAHRAWGVEAGRAGDGTNMKSRCHQCVSCSYTFPIFPSL